MILLVGGLLGSPRPVIEQHRRIAPQPAGIASGSWSLVNFVLLRTIGPWLGWMNARRWEEIFWLIAVLPAVGIGVWLVLSRNER